MISGKQTHTGPATVKPPFHQMLSSARAVSFPDRAPMARYVLVIVAVAVVSGVMSLVDDHLGILNVLLIYLLLCFGLALIAGPGPAALAAVLAFLAFNFLFVPPVHTFRVANGDDVLALLAFLGIAIVTSQLVAGFRRRTEVLAREQRRTELLYDLNASLISGVTLDAMLATIVERVVLVYGATGSRVLLPDDGDLLKVSARFPATLSDMTDRQTLAVAAWAMEHRQTAGRGGITHRSTNTSGAHPGAGVLRRSENEVLFLPIRTAEHVVGVLEVSGRPGGGRFRDEDEQLLTSFANQAALALERARLTSAAAKAAALAESDAFKSALLSDISHDLRTPLAVIKASSSALLDSSVTWDDRARSELLHAIDEESDRLTRMVGNLLDLTRIEGAVLRPDAEWYDVAELVADVVHRPGIQGSTHLISTEIDPDLPLVLIDYVKIAQVLANLIENAIKFTPDESRITVSAVVVAGAVEIAVADNGAGIAQSDLKRVFDKFYRSDRHRDIPGTGIGLAISKGFVEAHGGRIWAERNPDRGTTVRFTLPLPVPGDQPHGE